MSIALHLAANAAHAWQLMDLPVPQMHLRMPGPDLLALAPANPPQPEVPQPPVDGPGDLFDGLAPDWGPFGGVGTTAKTILGVIMAAVLAICIGTAFLGASKIRLGQSEFSHDPIAVKDGRKLIIGGALGAFLVAAMATLFTIVYGMGGGIGG